MTRNDLRRRAAPETPEPCHPVRYTLGMDHAGPAERMRAAGPVSSLALDLPGEATPSDHALDSDLATLDALEVREAWARFIAQRQSETPALPVGSRLYSSETGRDARWDGSRWLDAAGDAT